MLNPKRKDLQKPVKYKSNGEEQKTAIAENRKGKKGTIIRPTIDTPASQQARIKEAILSVQAATKMPQIKPIHQLSVTGILHEERLAAFKVSGKKKFIKPSAPRYRNCSTVSGSR